MTQEQLDQVVYEHEKKKADGRNILAVGSLSIMAVALYGTIVAQDENIFMNNLLLAAFGALVGCFTLTTYPKKK